MKVESRILLSRRSLLRASVAALAAGGGARTLRGQTAVRVAVQDPSPWHVHPPGEPFRITVSHDYSGPYPVSAQWRDFRGRELSGPIPLPAGRATEVLAPAGEIGYYGLALHSDAPDLLFNPDSGRRRELGFAILPEIPFAARRLKPLSPFGLIHFDLEDPYLHPGYVKTATTTQYRNPEQWARHMQARRDRGLIELPINLSDSWRGSSDEPISQAELYERYTEMKRIFEADPAVLYWELGIEENLWKGSRGPYYWPNLAAKFRIVQQAAGEVNPAIRLIYQIEGFRYGFFSDFFSSDAPPYIDILSLHPYRWPDFPSPEDWLENHIVTVRALMQNAGFAMPIWFTEVGAPHHGNPDPNGFFGYRKGAPNESRIQGTTREGNAFYLIKMHALAFSLGVEKVFWYNYRDRGPDIENPEHHFGLVDYWRHPKPSYCAYANLVRCLEGKRFHRRSRLPGDVWLFEFRGASQDCFVLWAYPAAEREISLAALRPGLDPSQVIGLRDTVGGVLPAPAGDVLEVDEAPRFLIVKPQSVRRAPAGRGASPRPRLPGTQR